jgi:endo-1,4-beta-mannosidase
MSSETLMSNYSQSLQDNNINLLTRNQDILQFVNGLTSKPIWLTETGKPSAFENNTEQGQAEYLSYVYITAKPLVSKIFFYEFRDGQGADPPKENHFGLLTLDGTQKEAYQILWNINRNQEKT